MLILRSPMAEIVFKEVVKERELESKFYVDSCGTSAYHIGDGPDKRSVAECKKKYPNLKVTHRARQLCDNDFRDFDYIFCMDKVFLSFDIII